MFLPFYSSLLSFISNPFPSCNMPLQTLSGESPKKGEAIFPFTLHSSDTHGKQIMQCGEYLMLKTSKLSHLLFVLMGGCSSGGTAVVPVIKDRWFDSPKRLHYSGVLSKALNLGSCFPWDPPSKLEMFIFFLGEMDELLQWSLMNPETHYHEMIKFNCDQEEKQGYIMVNVIWLKIYMQLLLMEQCNLEVLL